MVTICLHTFRLFTFCVYLICFMLLKPSLCSCVFCFILPVSLLCRLCLLFVIIQERVASISCGKERRDPLLVSHSGSTATAERRPGWLPRVFRDHRNSPHRVTLHPIPAPGHCSQHTMGRTAALPCLAAAAAHTDTV